MTTGEILLIVGLGIVGFFVVTKVTGGQSTNVNTSPVRPSGSSVSQSAANGLQNLAGRIGGFGGTVVAQAAGLGPASPYVSVASSSLLRTEVSGFRSAGSGVSEIAHGNIGTGLKDIGKGAVETAAAPF